MSVEIIVAPEVELDLAEAYAWYEQRRNGLGEEFLSCVDACIQSIRRYPRSYSIIHESFRRALVRRFPYTVFYEFADQRVTVYAILHAARDPSKWRTRLPEQ